MKSSLAKCLGVIAFALLLSASVSQQMAQAQTAATDDITQQRLLIKGDTWPAPLEVNVALSNETNLRMALEEYGNFPGTPNLGNLISQIRSANGNPAGQVPGMTGLGGALGHGFINAADSALNQSNGNFDTTQQVILAVSGQITDYAFVEDGNTGRGNGRLEVITYVTSTKVPHGNGPLITRTEAYKWKIRVINNGFRIVPKGTDPNDPFPGTLQFTPEMVNRINFLGFMFKLWVKGTDIKIDEVARKAGNSSHFVVLPKSNPEFAKLYAEIGENCIDMMFVDRPPSTLGGMQPPLYCLGRCQSPLIVNTGV